MDDLDATARKALAHYDECGCHDSAERLADALRAMLPQPGDEWEYGYRSTYADMHPTRAGERIEEIWVTSRTPDNWLPQMNEIYRRRKATAWAAGTWEPEAARGVTHD